MTYDSLYLKPREIFDMSTGEPFHIFSFDTGAITLKKIYSSDNKTIDTKRFQGYENIHFNAYLGTKVDYFHFNNVWQLQTSTIELLRNDWTRTLNYFQHVMISYENWLLVGYTLTRNRSNFLMPTGNILLAI